MSPLTDSLPRNGMKHLGRLGLLEEVLLGGQGAPAAANCSQKPEGTPWVLGLPLAVMSSRVGAATSKASNLVPAAEQAVSLIFRLRTAGVASGGLPPGVRGALDSHGCEVRSLTNSAKGE